MEVLRVLPGTQLWRELADYAENCSWVAGKHLAQMLRENRFHDWEAVFAAVENGAICGYCTLLETDYYPENRYHPWISSMFVDERARGNRLSGSLIEAAAAYARDCGFRRAYIPSDISGLYEKYGFAAVDTLVNYGGDTDTVYARDL